MSRILIVEDNPKFREGAEKYIITRSDISPNYAIDYDEAISKIYGNEHDGIVTDCFFPKSTGSGDISLGKEIVESMALSDPDETRARESIAFLEPYIDLSDPEMKDIIDSYIHSMGSREATKEPTFLAIKKVGDTLGKEAATKIAKESLGLIYTPKSMRDSSSKRRDYYGALNKAMIESEHNQPLGILVAEKAEELGIPKVLATSTYHHDILTQPIQNYASKKGWHLVDCNQDSEHQKETPEFWERVFQILKREVSK